MNRLNYFKRMKLILIGILICCAMTVYAEQQPESQNEQKQFQEKEQEALKKKVPELIEWLKNPRWVVREGVIRDLSRSKDSRAVEPLTKVMLEDKDKSIRIYAAGVLSQFDDNRIIEIFKKQVLKNGEFKILGSTVLMKLGSKEEKELALPILEKYAEEGHPEVLSYIKVNVYGQKKVDILVFYNENSALQILKTLLNNNDDEVRANAAYYLNIGLDEKEASFLAASDIAKNSKLTGVKRKRIFETIIQVLNNVGDEKSILALGQILNREKEESIKSNAKYALRKLKREDMIIKHERQNELKKIK